MSEPFLIKETAKLSDIIEITDFKDPKLDVYARTKEIQLLNRANLEEGIFIAESPKVVERALDAGYVAGYNGSGSSDDASTDSSDSSTGDGSEDSSDGGDSDFSDGGSSDESDGYTDGSDSSDGDFSDSGE